MIVDILFTAGLMLLAFLAQTVVFPVLGITAVAPNLLIASAVSVALLCGPYVGMTAGALAGCVLDIFFSPGVGVTAMPLAAIGYLAGVKNTRFRPENVLAPAVIALLGHMGMDLFSLILLYLTRNPAALGGAVFLRGILSALMTGAVAVPAYLLCYRVYTRGNRRRDSGQMMLAG